MYLEVVGEKNSDLITKIQDELICLDITGIAARILEQEINILTVCSLQHINQLLFGSIKLKKNQNKNICKFLESF